MPFGPCDGPTYTWLDTGVAAEFYCPLCRRWHHHCAEGGWRVAHCGWERTQGLYEEYELGPSVTVIKGRLTRQRLNLRLRNRREFQDWKSARIRPH